MMDESGAGELRKDGVVNYLFVKHEIAPDQLSGYVRSRPAREEKA